MIQYKHDLNASSGIKILFHFLGGYSVDFRIPVPHQVNRKVSEISLQVYKIIEVAVFPVVINDALDVAKQTNGVGERKKGKCGRVLKGKSSLIIGE